MFISLVVQGIRRAVLQQHISNESIFFFLLAFTVQLLYPFIVIENTKVRMTLALVFNAGVSHWPNPTGSQRTKDVIKATGTMQLPRI